METLKFTRASDKQFARLRPYLRGEADYVTSLDALVEQGMAWLYQRGFVYPGDRPIRDYARLALQASKAALLEGLVDGIAEQIIRSWEAALLATRHDDGCTC